MNFIISFFWIFLLSLNYYFQVPTINAAPLIIEKRHTSEPFDFTAVQTLYSFGDSYTTQNLDVLTMTYACPNCTSAGGRNWVEYLVDLHPMKYWNLAYNSAPISNAMVGQSTSAVTDVTKQITSMFPQYFNTAQQDPSTSLYTIWVGINDIDLTADWSDTDELDRKLMRQYRSLVEYLMTQHNARQFVLINVPPIDRSPMWQSRGSDAVNMIQRRVHEYNKKLASITKRLRKKNSGYFYLFDAWDTFTTILDNPEHYHITHATDYCADWSHPVENNCSSIEQYFWYNDLHPTYKIHEYVAHDIFNFLQKHSSYVD